MLGLLRSLAALGALVSVRVFIYPGLSLFVSPTLAASICVLPGSVVVSKHCFDEVARIDRTREVFLLERSVRRPRLPAARLITR